VLGTAASLGLLVQLPSQSRLLSLRPLHNTDWILVSVAFAAVCITAFTLFARLQDHVD
jgi:hypothetical protein